MNRSELDIDMNYPGLCVMQQCVRISTPNVSECAHDTLAHKFACNVVQIRKHQGISGAELCRCAHIRTSSLYNIEHELSCARLDTIEKIASALHVEPYELLR